MDPTNSFRPASLRQGFGRHSFALAISGGLPPEARKGEGWWRRLDSNQRRHSQRVYSPSPLATRALLRAVFLNLAPPIRQPTGFKSINKGSVINAHAFIAPDPNCKQTKDLSRVPFDFLLQEARNGQRSRLETNLITLLLAGPGGAEYKQAHDEAQAAKSRKTKRKISGLPARKPGRKP